MILAPSLRHAVGRRLGGCAGGECGNRPVDGERFSSGLRSDSEMRSDSENGVATSMFTTHERAGRPSMLPGFRYLHGLTRSLSWWAEQIDPDRRLPVRRRECRPARPPPLGPSSRGDAPARVTTASEGRTTATPNRRAWFSRRATRVRPPTPDHRPERRRRRRRSRTRILTPEAIPVIKAFHTRRARSSPHLRGPSSPSPGGHARWARDARPPIRMPPSPGSRAAHTRRSAREGRSECARPPPRCRRIHARGNRPGRSPPQRRCRSSVGH